MSTLLLQLVGPMQSWGVQSHFTHRDTGLEPSKSGVVGLLCAAMGIDRADDKPMQDIAALRMGVRADREGLVKYDYHTAMDVLKASGKDTKDTEVSHRFYLADAAFLVGLESMDDDLLRRIDRALRHPRWPLFLGRKAFVPSEPIVLDDGLKAEGLESALGRHPRLRGPRDRYGDGRARVVIEDRKGEVVRPDQPISFARDARKCDLRRVRVEFIDVPSSSGAMEDINAAPLPLDS